MTKFSVRLERFCVLDEEKEKGYNILDLKGYGKLYAEYIYYGTIEGYWYPTPKALAESEDPNIRDLNIAEAPFYVSVRYRPKDIELHHRIMELDRAHIYDVLKNTRLELETLVLCE